MKIATDQRPAIGTVVSVSYAGSDGYDAETIIGEVAFHYPDGFDVVTLVAPSETTTVFDSEQASGRAVLEVL